MKKKEKQLPQEAPKYRVGDLIRSIDSSNANTLYRIIKVKAKQRSTFRPELEWNYTARPIFGLFKSDYVGTKSIHHTDTSYRLVTLLDLAHCRNQLDLFIQQEARKLSE